jgi:hypothetical protein
VDVGFQQRHTHGAHRVGDIGFCDFTVAPEILEGILEFIGELAEHESGVVYGSRGIRRGGNLPQFTRDVCKGCTGGRIGRSGKPNGDLFFRFLAPVTLGSGANPLLIGPAPVLTNPRAMVHHIVLFKLKPEVTPEKIEEMLLQTRMRLLKISEVLSVKCGKRIDPRNEWEFFIALDFESMEKLGIYQIDAIHIKYVEEVIKPNTRERVALDYEMEPGKDVKYS